MTLDFETNFKEIKEYVEKIDVSNLDDFAFQFDIVGEGSGTFYIELKNGKLSIQPYDYHDRTALVIVSQDDLISILSGQNDFIEKLRENQLKIANNYADGFAKVTAFFDAAFLSRYNQLSSRMNTPLGFTDTRTINPWDALRDFIEKSDIDEESKSQLLTNIVRFTNNELHILIVGGSGCGKSSTINALFNTDLAEVGYGVDPKTQKVSVYKLDNLFLHDTPGLGESPEKDIEHIKKIIKALKETDKNGNAIIDSVLVIVDGSHRDMRTSFELINNVIMPNLQDKNRILVAINRCDLALDGRGWISRYNLPNGELASRLEEKVNSVKRRIKKDTGVDVQPIVYSALYKYNISKLLSYLVKSVPTKKRIFLAEKINRDENNFIRDDTFILKKKSSNTRQFSSYTDQLRDPTATKIPNSAFESLKSDVKEMKAVLTNVESDLSTIKKETHTVSSPESVPRVSTFKDDEYEIERAAGIPYKEDIRKSMEESLDEVEKEINMGVRERIKLRFVEGVESAAKGIEAGVKLAKAIPVIGDSVITHAVGAGLGAIGGFFAGIFGRKNAEK